ncbi:MAG: RloB family protein [Pyrinomonadaceae bacterium]
MSKPRLNRNTRQRKPKKAKPICVIATEGKETEKIYFDKIREIYRDKYTIHILPTDQRGKSAPKHIVQRIENFKRKKVSTNLKNDEYWAIVDFDSWGEEQLAEAHRVCESNKFELAVSNPCFELWLNFHQDKPKSPKTCAECKKQVEKLLGVYDKNDYDAEKLIEKVASAINKAEQLHQNKSEPFPKETGTHVYKLVQKLIG